MGKSVSVNYKGATVVVDQDSDFYKGMIKTKEMEKPESEKISKVSEEEKKSSKKKSRSKKPKKTDD